MDLFASQDAPFRPRMDDADVVYHASADLGIAPDDLMARLLADIPWKQRPTSWGTPEPRMTSWHADEGVSYRYSGTTMMPQPFGDTLETVRRSVERATGARFNSVLLNHYRDGKDSINFHADDEPELGRDPTIASVSLGAERVFEMKRGDGTGPTIRIPLGHGSLLVMAGATQRHWKHGIRKTKAAVEGRINLTFRMTGRR